jgi:hypothetical protein
MSSTMDDSELIRISQIAIPSDKISLLSQTPILRCSTSLDLLTRILNYGWLRSSHGFATRNLEHPTFGLPPLEPLSSRDPWISTTYPPWMDDSDPLVASPLTTWSIQILDSYPMNLRAHKIPRSLLPVLLRWMALILSWLRH